MRTRPRAPRASRASPPGWLARWLTSLAPARDLAARVAFCALGLANLGSAEFSHEGTTTVDVALLLAVDVSNSVDWWEYELQRHGLSHAIRDPGVVGAIQSGPNRRVAIAVVQWAGKRSRYISIRWTVLHDQPSAEAFARVVEFMPREFAGDTTHIAGMLDYGAELMKALPFTATRKVIDISGDGRENVIDHPEPARDRAVAAGITINGLAIENEEPQLRFHYRDQVIGGPGAFVLPIKRYEDFAEAMKKKLIREIDPRQVSTDSRWPVLLVR